MVTFVIFWNAVLLIVLFFVGTFFKALISMFDALISSIKEIIIYAAIVFGIFLALAFIVAFEITAREKGFSSLIMEIIGVGIIIALIVGVLMFLGPYLLIILQFVIGIILLIIGGLGELCEKGYKKLLTNIFKYLDRC